jgi:tetratricopeptide (TPR) repeat protein
VPIARVMLRGHLIRACSVAAIVASASVAAAAPTQAELAAFQSGKTLYENGKHEEAARYFALATDGPTPSIRDSGLVNQARMIRGASDMYLGRIGDADQQFERILRNNPKFEPDAILYPPGVLDEFRRIRDKLDKEAEEKKAGDLASKKIAELENENAKLGTRVKALEEYAKNYETVILRSRIIASIPFGVGQFQNGDPGLGVFFAAAQGISLTAATASFLYQQSIPRVPVNGDEARSAASIARVVNWISVGAFVALAVGGIAQAHIAFVPESRVTRVRPLPKSLSFFHPMASPVDGGAVIGLGAIF